MFYQPSHSRCSAPSDNGRGSHLHLNRCVDCRKPLFNQTWKEKLKGQLRAKFSWPSKKRHEVKPFGRYVVKQRCSECQEPLRCSECSEAFFGNLSPEEIRVFIKAMVLYAMKGLCGDCSDSFRLVYHELFEAASSSTSPTTTFDSESRESRSYSGSCDEEVDPEISEIQALNDFPNGERRKGVRFGATGWKGGVALGDWKREIDDLLGNRFQLVLER